MIQFGFPTAHKLTFLSSPPVTSTLPDLCPRARQFTLAPCATNSSAIKKWHVRNFLECKHFALRKHLVLPETQKEQHNAPFFCWNHGKIKTLISRKESRTLHTHFSSNFWHLCELLLFNYNRTHSGILLKTATFALSDLSSSFLDK